VRGILSAVDAAYRRAYALRPVGPVLFVGLSRRGSMLRKAGRARGAEPQPVAHLHFNNARAAEIQATGRLQNGMRFGRLLRDSFVELAKHARDDAAFREIAAYEGVTWFGSHGDAVGFQSEPLSEGWRRRWLAAHFRLLVWAFSPTGDKRAFDEIAPRHFRITREALIAAFADRKRAG
jgi:hypothetical protein